MTDMDSVNLFNTELSSLYDVKPPISKGKMTAITKAALKAVKLYKHVVQSVEKFIQKCKPEYKIPGLYVIDSIIRQSRHQFGNDKDIFAGRFARNLQTTFVHLYRCPVEDKAKVIRVLNLWQKNKIFQPEVIQPLFDLADPNNPIWNTVQIQASVAAESAGPSTHNNSGSATNHMNNSSSSLGYSSEVQFKTSLLDYDYDEDTEDAGQLQQQQQSSSQQQQQMHQQQQQAPGGVGITANALAGMDALGSILNNPEVLRQLRTLQEQMTAAAQAQATVQHQQQMGYLSPEQERERKLAELNKQEAAFDQRLAQTVAKLPFAVECGDFTESQESKSKSPARASDPNSSYHGHNSVDQNSNQLTSHNSGMLLPPPFFQHLNPEQLQQAQHHGSNIQPNQSTGTAANPFGIPLNFPMGMPPPPFQQHQEVSQGIGMFGSQIKMENSNFQPFNQNQHMFDSPHLAPINEDRVRDRRDRDRDRDRDGRRRRSGERDRGRSGSRGIELSPSKSTRRRHSRSNSRSRSSRRSEKKSRSAERREEKERQRKGFGVMKREHLSVCSTTLWVGHLSKLVSQEEISDTFGSYGDVVSIDMIASRGCAFVVMNRRQDACRALDRLKNTKLQGKTITLAWAPGKGVKGRDWKDYWEVEEGISYIPWHKLRPDTDVEEFEDGGCIDETTLPDFIRDKPRKPVVEKLEDNVETNNNVSSTGTTLTSGLAEGAAVPGAVGDIDSRTEAQPPAPVPPPMQPGLPTGVPPPMSQPFGLAPPVGLMAPMGLNMMMPPPLMGGPMGLGQFGIPNMANMQQMMSMMGPMNPNLGMPQDSSAMNPLPPPGAGLLGEMPLSTQQMNNTLTPTTVKEEVDDENRKRRPDRRENRERKRSRFDNPDERITSPHDTDARKSPSFRDRNQNQQEEPPLFDRLKSIAEGYGFGSSPDPMKLQMQNNLLGAPIGPNMGGGTPRGPGPNAHGFPHNMRGGRDQFGGPGPRTPFMGDRPPGPGGPGPRPWFDAPPNSQNPFLNPTQNPFTSNPFVPNPTNANENPFDIGGPGPDMPGPGKDRDFFGNNENQFQNRRGGPPVDGPGWGRDGPGQWGRGRPPGPMIGARGRGGRGGGPNNWREEGRDEFMEFRGGFRGGRGGPPRGGGRGGRDWDRGEHNDRGGRDDRGGRGDWDRGRDRDRGDRDRDRDWNRDRDNNRRRRSHSRERDSGFNRSRGGFESRFSDNNQNDRIRSNSNSRRSTSTSKEWDMNETAPTKQESNEDNWDNEDLKGRINRVKAENTDDQTNETEEQPSYEEEPSEPLHHRGPKEEPEDQQDNSYEEPEDRREDSYEEPEQEPFPEEPINEPNYHESINEASYDEPNNEPSYQDQDVEVKHSSMEPVTMNDHHFDLKPERQHEESYENNLIEAREEEYAEERTESLPDKKHAFVHPLPTDDSVNGPETTSLPINGNGCSTNESNGNNLIQDDPVT